MIMINNIEVETINNEVIIGEMLIFIENLFRSEFDEGLKILGVGQGLKIIDEVLLLIDDYDLGQEEN